MVCRNLAESFRDQGRGALVQSLQEGNAGTSETKRRTKTVAPRIEPPPSAGSNRDSRNRTRNTPTPRESGLRNLAPKLAYGSCRRECFIGQGRGRREMR